MIIDISDRDEVLRFRNKMIRKGGVEEQVDKYLNSLVSHIRYVREAGRNIGVPAEQLEVHDDSKFSGAEFLAAVERFHGGDPNPDRYARAWLHHIHHNPHHWQYWIFPDGFVPKGSSVESGVVEMPGNYALEMIADWMGSSMAYTGAWDMTKWLWENMPRIRLHSKTADFVRIRLDMLGYADTVYMQRWAHEKGE